MRPNDAASATPRRQTPAAIRRETVIAADVYRPGALRDDFERLASPATPMAEADILSLFTTNFYCTVKFYNQATAGYTTRQMYVSDRTGGMWRRGPKTGGVMGWTGCKLSLVEV